MLTESQAMVAQDGLELPIIVVHLPAQWVRFSFNEAECGQQPTKFPLEGGRTRWCKTFPISIEVIARREGTSEIQQHTISGFLLHLQKELSLSVDYAA